MAGMDPAAKGNPIQLAAKTPTDETATIPPGQCANRISAVTVEMSMTSAVIEVARTLPCNGCICFGDHKVVDEIDIGLSARPRPRWGHP